MCAGVVLVFSYVVGEMFKEYCLLIVGWCVCCAFCLDDGVLCGVWMGACCLCNDWVGIVFGGCVGVDADVVLCVCNVCC